MIKIVRWHNCKWWILLISVCKKIKANIKCRHIQIIEEWIRFYFTNPCKYKNIPGSNPTIPNYNLSVVKTYVQYC
jgi:hypothetical protein